MKNTVLITGASKGIGKKTAYLFAKQGYHVAINYFQSKDSALFLEKEINSMGYSAMCVKADVSDRKQVENMIKEVGNIDILINNAGVAEQKLFTDISENDWDRIFNINVKGMFNCCQAVLPYMINNKKGKIVNISSIWGIVGASCEVHYSSSKAAVIGFTKALAKELGPSGIQVNCVAPGLISTDMNSSLCQDTVNDIIDMTPLCRVGTPDDIANTIYFLASDKSDFITGQVISVNGGLVI